MSTSKTTTNKPEQPEGIGVKEIAEKLGVEPRELRVWLRSKGQGVGRGGKRYEFTAEQATKIQRDFRKDAKAQAEEQE